MDIEDLKRIKGWLVDIGPDDDGQRVEVCPLCKQAFDPLDFAELFHHAIAGHQPLPRH